jgi:hypothetical protein
LSITTNEDALLGPNIGANEINYTYSPLMQNEGEIEIGKKEKLKLLASQQNIDSKSDLSDPSIPKKHDHAFNYIVISIKNIFNNIDLYNEYTKSVKNINKLP